jgi:Mg2+ and Co2+ transporter CorA
VFGMNVDYPGEGTEAGFWTIVAGMAVVIGGMVAFFRWKRWF